MPRDRKWILETQVINTAVRWPIVPHEFACEEEASHFLWAMQEMWDEENVRARLRDTDGKVTRSYHWY